MENPAQQEHWQKGEQSSSPVSLWPVSLLEITKVALPSSVADAPSAQGITLSVTLEIDAIASVIDLVARGYGHAILSRIAVESWAKDGGLRATPIVKPAITSRVVLATSRERPLTALAEGAIGLLHADIVPSVRRIVRGRD